MIDFNINGYVWVRLTDRGRRIHREQHEQLLRDVPGMSIPYSPPVEEDGWSRWQLWCLMAHFGPYIGAAMDEPFETGIQIEVDGDA